MVSEGIVNAVEIDEDSSELELESKAAEFYSGAVKVDAMVESVGLASVEIDLASIDVTDKSDSAIATGVFEDGDLDVSTQTEACLSPINVDRSNDDDQVSLDFVLLSDSALVEIMPKSKQTLMSAKTDMESFVAVFDYKTKHMTVNESEESLLALINSENLCVKHVRQNASEYILPVELESSLPCRLQLWKGINGVQRCSYVKLVDGNYVYDKGKSDMYDKEWYGAVVEEKLMCSSFTGDTETYMLKGSFSIQNWIKEYIALIFEIIVELEYVVMENYLEGAEPDEESKEAASKSQCLEKLNKNGDEVLIMLDTRLDELDLSMSLSALSCRRGLMERCGSKIGQLSRFLRVNGNPSRIQNILLDKGSEKFQKGRAQLRQAIADAEAELVDICSSMVDMPIIHVRQSGSGSLKDKLKIIIPLLEEMRAKRSVRKKQFLEIIEQLQTLSEEIHGSTDGRKVFLDKNDLSEMKLEDLRRQLHELQNEQTNRLKLVTGYLHTLNLLCTVLGIDYKEKIIEMHDSDEVKGIHSGTIDKLSAAIQSLQALRTQRMQRLQEIAVAILELWNLMDTPVEEQQKVQNITSNIAVSEEELTEPNILSADFISYAEAELSKLEQLKLSKMKDLVLKKSAGAAFIDMRRVRQAERGNWLANRGVDEEILMANLPEDLQTDIRRHQLKFIKEVRIFSAMDEYVLDFINERLKKKTYTKGSQILLPGGPIKNMTFIMSGKMKIIGEDRYEAELTEGDVCGEELLLWCLEDSLRNQEAIALRTTVERPISNQRVTCITDVEVFTLGALDLKEVN